ncbi:MAG: WG repeat-containing protein [Helicobacteraceae bacterium]|nr:WG repeat-containing protein [Helicobacteraceae bacterium]
MLNRPPRFESASDFAANGLAVVKANGKWGYIRAPSK